MNDLYDFSANSERMTLRNALEKYDYCGQYWQNSDAIVVNIFTPTPIWCILDKSNGKWFDKDWNEIKNRLIKKKKVKKKTFGKY